MVSRLIVTINVSQPIRAAARAASNRQVNLDRQGNQQLRHGLRQQLGHRIVYASRARQLPNGISNIEYWATSNLRTVST